MRISWLTSGEHTPVAWATWEAEYIEGRLVIKGGTGCAEGRIGGCRSVLGARSAFWFLGGGFSWPMGGAHGSEERARLLEHARPPSRCTRCDQLPPWSLLSD